MTPPLLSPGWIDLQVNGFGGINLSAGDLQPEQVCALSALLLCEGVTHWCPTLITGPNPRISNAIRAILQARRADRRVRAALLGIHLEGPYISPLDGFRGAHPKADVRPPDWAEFSRWQEQAEGFIRIVTLAPEVTGAMPFIQRAAASGMVVGIGHSNATADEIRAAVDVGARFSTHLGNGMSAQIHRHHNPLWPQLAEDRLYAGAICDGFHLPPDFMQVLYRVKGKTRLILTSDVTHLAHLPPGVYETEIGGKVELHPNGKLTLYGSADYLAGSASSLKDCLQIALARLAIPLEDALEMVTTTPRALLGLGPSTATTQFTWNPERGELTVLGTESK
jgi:N-acetylglucosamine-6-phosphate deacetylase